MEEILLRFPQIGEKILNFLDEKSLQNCKIVNKNLKNFIEDPSQKLLCIRSIKNYEQYTHIKRYISIPGNWNELKCEELGEFVKEIRMTKNKYQMELLFLDKYEIIGTKLGAYDEMGLYALHWYISEINNTFWDDMNFPKQIKDKISEKLITKFREYDIDVNAEQKYNCKSTALHLACLDGNTDTVRMLINTANDTNLDLEAKCLNSTALELAILKDKYEIIDIITSRNTKA